MNSIGMKLRAIPSGQYWMGSPRLEPGRRAEERRHRVKLTNSFYLGVHEVTQQQYARVMKENPSEFARGGVQGARVAGQATEHFPVDSVNWHQAVQFCQRLSKLPAEQSADRRYRLPTEAEWEYAARAGTDTIWSFGRRVEQLPLYGWYRRSSDRRTHTVGEKRPNAWGLYDMYGNVWEWCLDWHAAAYYQVSPTQDPTGPNGGDTRVLRGGGWASGAARCRSASRVGDPPTVGDPDTGFRVLMLQRGAPPSSSRE
ncbi:MAG: formylglycine-generating enzyme family protein [Planctomycetota bacterium]|nr:formylglycine-generating enzyme family protein [Planctomycetota bacterium]